MAQLGAVSRQLCTKLGPTETQHKFDPSRLLVGPGRPASFLSVITILWVRAVLIAKQLEYIMPYYVKPCTLNCNTLTCYCLEISRAKWNPTVSMSKDNTCY